MCRPACTNTTASAATGGSIRGAAKKKKRTQKVDSRMLGFTVVADP